MSRWINQKTMAALFAVGAAGGAGVMMVDAPPESAPLAIERVVYQPRPAGARSWGGLQDGTMIYLNNALKNIQPKRVEIYCPGNYCRDLAEDLDEVFESAGFDSYLEAPVFDPGKGMGIAPDTPDTRAIAKAILDGSSGTLDLQVFAGDEKAKDKIVIALARKAALPKQ